MVGQALDLLVPDFAVDPDDLLPVAYAGAAGARSTRRRRRTVAVIAFAALLLFAGAAIAADKAGLLPFLHTNDRNSARFSVSRTSTYHGAAPLALTCPGAKSGSFTCNVSGVMAPGNRNYELGMRTDRAPVLTRQSMLDSLEHAQGVDRAQVARVRADLAAVGDDFIRALAVLTRVETVGGAGQSGPAGTERVPPPGVPAWAACREVTLASFRCRPLAASVGVAGRTPLYFLQPSRDWRRVKAPPQDPSAFGRELELVLGRKLTAAETRFFFDFATVAATATGSSSGPTKTQGTQIAASNPRGTAMLAPQSLGVRTRVVSAAAQPLPHRLPVGLNRFVETRLYRVVFDLLRSSGHDAAGRHTIYVYVTHSPKLGVWQVAWVGTKP
jgi:hypothetical protein